MLLSTLACAFSLVAAGTIDISISVHLSSLEASSMIFKDSSLSNNAFISFVILKLVLVRLCSLHYTCFVPDR